MSLQLLKNYASEIAVRNLWRPSNLRKIDTSLEDSIDSDPSDALCDY
jgi:hypothetical protein